MRQWINLTESTSMILYHGTPETFDKFDIEKIVDGGPFGRGIHFTNSYKTAKIYSGDQEPLKANITLKNPYIVSRSGDSEFSQQMSYSQQTKIFRPVSTARERLMKMGYDGMVLKEDDYIEVVVYDVSTIDILGRGK